MKPQTQQVFEHLKRKGSITQMQALRLYGVGRLAARIGELRAAGYGIETEYVSQKAPKTGRFARYRYYSRRVA
jgi:uncharacterized small protein (DUF1192 family)